MSLREQKTAKKKEDILLTALSVLSEKGYHGTTMEDVASKLYMTKGSVYYYFKDKQDLLYQSHVILLKKSLDNLGTVQNKELPAADKLRMAMVVHVKYLLSERSGFEMMMKPEHIFSPEHLKHIFQLRDDYGRRFDQLIRDGAASGAFRLVDVKIVRNIFLGAMNWVTQWYSAEGKKDRDDIAEDISDYLLRILMKD